MQSAKERASNLAASAKSGKDKAQATAQEKVEKLTAHDPMERDMARQKKEERVDQAEFDKEAARERNASARQHSATQGHGTDPLGRQTHDYTDTGTDIPPRRVTEGIVGSQNPPGEHTGTGRVPIRHTGAGVGHPEERG